MADIFVSYAREDAAQAAKVVEALKRHGWTVFWDRTIPAGRQWDQVLKRQLDAARCTVVLWSAHSLASEWVLHEASIARHRNVLVPALLEANLASDRRISPVFRSVQAIRMAPQERPDGEMLADLVKAVERVIGRPRRKALLGLAALGAGMLAWYGPRIRTTVEEVGTATSRALRNEATLRKAGVKWVLWGGYEAEEDERNARLIRDAQTIDLIVTNANSFVAKFRKEIVHFFGRPDARMRVMFASSETPFYLEMMKMTGKLWKDAEAQKGDMLRAAVSRQDLASAAVRPDQIEFRYYNTQYRMPVILIDGRYCIVTVRLPPDEGQESLRIESDEQGVPTTMSRAASGVEPRVLPHVAQSCRSHFERMWLEASPTPIKGG